MERHECKVQIITDIEKDMPTIDVLFHNKRIESKIYAVKYEQRKWIMNNDLYFSYVCINLNYVNIELFNVTQYLKILICC
jgi:hypothetical protein